MVTCAHIYYIYYNTHIYSIYARIKMIFYICNVYISAIFAKFKQNFVTSSPIVYLAFTAVCYIGVVKRGFLTYNIILLLHHIQFAETVVSIFKASLSIIYIIVVYMLLNFYGLVYLLYIVVARVF